ncbi:MAG: pitrilysin family protein [Armatimonadota bacterium]|nr:pitrilysin family protein [Armatimonadota bacterium]MDW8290484.1 pitrilysin family protein [Armatimonadota bacterium]
MSCTVWFLVLWCGLLALSPARAGSLPPESIQLRTLPNGLRVLVREAREAPLVTIDLWVRAGSVRETPETNGVAHMIEHLLFRGTAKRGRGEVDRDIEDLGATLNATTSRDWMHLYTTVASQYWKQALEVVADAVQNSALRPDDVEREQMIILDELARAADDPIRDANQRLAELLFQKHPYRLPVAATRDAIIRIQREQVVEFYRKYYVPNNASLVIVGDVKEAEAFAMAEKLFGDWQRREITDPEPEPEPPPDSPRHARFRVRRSAPVVGIGFQAPPVKEVKDVCACDVLLALLGRRDGLLTRLLVVEAKVATRVTTEFLTQRYPGLFSIVVELPEGGNPQQVEAMVVGALQQLAKTPVSEAELTRAKREILGEYLFGLETTEGQASTLGFYEMIDTYQFALDYEKNILAVTVEDVRRAVEKYLHPDRRVVVTLTRE